MDQSYPNSDQTLIAETTRPVASCMGRLASVVRGLTTELLCASDTRIIKIAAENAAGWSVEVEVFAPNPELTVSLHGDKAILDRSRYRLHLDRDLELVALEPAEE
jgi:hypothetical protein